MSDYNGMAPWLREGLIYGALLCVFMSIVVVASLRQNPKIWAHDAPPPIRAQVGPLDARTRAQRRWWGVVVFAGLALIFGRLVMGVVTRYDGELSVGPIFAASLVCFEVFNLFDALVIDLSLAIFQPSWAMLPGIDMSAMRDARWHVRGFLVGLVMGVPFAGLVSGLGWVAYTFVLR